MVDTNMGMMDITAIPTMMGVRVPPFITMMGVRVPLFITMVSVSVPLGNILIMMNCITTVARHR
jgi:hypothetical protein